VKLVKKGLSFTGVTLMMTLLLVFDEDAASDALKLMLVVPEKLAFGMNVAIAPLIETDTLMGVEEVKVSVSLSESTK